MANPYGPPSFGARQPSYGGAPAGAYGVPGMGAPPGFDSAPGIAQSPAGYQGQFQAPPNMPNINFNAPVIRLGVDGGRPEQRGGDRGDRGDRGPRGGNAEPLGNRGRAGLGMDSRNLDRDRERVRESMQALNPPTREEVARTIFVGGLEKGAPNDEALSHILRSAGKLRRWTRARDADDQKCKFGFAEYEDVDSLEAANQIFRDLEVPMFKADGTVEKDEEGEVKKMKLVVVVDEASQKYITDWMSKRKEDENSRQFRLDTAKDELQTCLTNMANEVAHTNGVNGMNGGMEGDAAMGDTNGMKEDGVELITINATNLDEELADIPAEQRATVAEEIKAFRERSTRRDVERLRREEEMERDERQRNGGPPRVNRLASPPPTSAPSGPGGTNGVPSGPRGQQGVQGAPAGPKGYRGAQLPSDYVNGVAFVPGAGRFGRPARVELNREDEDAEESDAELERRREARRNSELTKEFRDQVDRWQKRERTRGMAQEREKNREEAERRNLERAKEDMLSKLANWNDDEEALKGRDLYYKDRSLWLRERERHRDYERREDEADRKAEEREQAEERRANNEADDFLDSLGDKMDTRADQPAPAAAAPAGFKISLGGARARQPGAGLPKKAMADVEGLLEDEEDAAASGNKRLDLKPLQDTSTLPMHGQDLDDDEKAAARQQLASEIPTDTAELFAHPIKWGALTPSLVDAQIRPFVERKVVEYLGVQEDLIVDTVIDGIREKRKAQDIKDDLEGPLEDEAEVMVKKVWRLMVFWGECESRGLGA
ncbi:putative RNA recognition motif domain, PWI domain, RNA-binding domain superfamily [Septoria linicola]|nr:putative RNA recognition motif domain, PWI domain, RNA-binding domain superfamily [Septoria linicola]